MEEANHMISRRRVLMGLGAAGTMALAGCGAERVENKCTGDCHLVEEYSMRSEDGTAFDDLQTFVTIIFKDDFTGSVTAKLYNDGYDRMAAADEQRVSGRQIVKFTFDIESNNYKYHVEIGVEADD